MTDNMTLRIRPELFALFAAMANGTIGIFNRYGFANGATHHQIAFFKCVGAFAVVLCLCLLSRQNRAEVAALRHQAPVLALLSFLGVFCLYFFETWAFAEASIPLVAFLTYAAGGFTIMLSIAVLKEPLRASKIAAFAVILAGVWFIFAFEGAISGSYLGIGLALIGGLGYALFIFASKLFNTGSGFAHLVWLFGFGCVYLFVPWAYDGMHLPPIGSAWAIALLVIIPTIGGFWLTMRAISAGNASSVQIIETSDPLFASLLALAVFGEWMSGAGLAGAGLIMCGLVLALRR